MSTEQKAETAQSRPYAVRSDGSVVDRSTGDEFAHVTRTDYGWDARLNDGRRTYMHRTRTEACDSAWGLRTPPASEGGQSDA